MSNPMTQFIFVFMLNPVKVGVYVNYLIIIMNEYEIKLIDMKKIHVQT